MYMFYNYLTFTQFQLKIHIMMVTIRNPSWVFQLTGHTLASPVLHHFQMLPLKQTRHMKEHRFFSMSIQYFFKYESRVRTMKVRHP